MKARLKTVGVEEYHFVMEDCPSSFHRYLAFVRSLPSSQQRKRRLVYIRRWRKPEPGEFNGFSLSVFPPYVYPPFQDFLWMDKIQVHHANQMDLWLLVIAIPMGTIF